MDPKSNLLVLNATPAVTAMDALLYREITDMGNMEVTQAWSILDHIVKTAKKRMDKLRERLLKEAETAGTLDDKGSSFLDLGDGAVVKREARTSFRLNDGKVLHLAEERGWDKEKVGSYTYSVDAKKVAALAVLGELSEEDLDVLSEEKVTYALKVTPPESVKRIIKG